MRACKSTCTCLSKCRGWARCRCSCKAPLNVSRITHCWDALPPPPKTHSYQPPSATSKPHLTATCSPLKPHTLIAPPPTPYPRQLKHTTKPPLNLSCTTSLACHGGDLSSPLTPLPPPQTYQSIRQHPHSLPPPSKQLSLPEVTPVFSNITTNTASHLPSCAAAPIGGAL